MEKEKEYWFPFPIQDHLDERPLSAAALVGITDSDARSYSADCRMQNADKEANGLRQRAIIYGPQQCAPHWQ